MAYFRFEDRRVYYRKTGRGAPLLLLHGNTASSRMFSSVLNIYKKYFTVILLDFPGHGKSEKVDAFESDFWYYNSRVAAALIMELELTKLSVIGTSGGALVAINLALEYPHLIKHLVADSFEGASPLPSYIATLEKDRARDKKKILARVFWFYCHGFTWKKVVDLDTRVNIEFSKSGRSFFHKSISELKTPCLLTGSRKDEYCSHLDRIYGDLKEQNSLLEILLFDEGYHPAMISNKKNFLEVILNTIKA